MKYIDADLLREKIVREVEQWKEKTANHYTIEAEARWSEANYILGIFDSLHLDTLSEEPDKSLEEAANKFAVFYDQGTCDGIAQDCFIAGAEWQKEQDDKETADLLTIAHLQGMEQMKGQLLQGSPMPEDTVLFNKGVQEGRRLEREDMLKDAVEGRVFMSFAPGHNQMVMADVDLPTNTKVRVLVIKAEEE